MHKKFGLLSSGVWTENREMWNGSKIHWNWGAVNFTIEFNVIVDHNLSEVQNSLRYYENRLQYDKIYHIFVC